LSLEENWIKPNRNIHSCFQAHIKSSVNVLKFIDDVLVTGSDDSTVCIWKLSNDLQTKVPTPVHVLSAKDHLVTDHELGAQVPTLVFSLDFDDDKRILASGGLDDCLRLWNMETGESVNTINTPHKGVVCELKMIKPYIITAGYNDLLLKVWDIEKLSCVQTLTGHKGKIYSIAATQNTIYSAGVTGIIKCWDRRSEKFTDSISNIHSIMAMHIEGDTLVSGDQEGSVTFWDIRNSKPGPLASLKTYASSVRDMQFDSTKLITCGKNNKINIYNIINLEKKIKF